MSQGNSRRKAVQRAWDAVAEEYAAARRADGPDSRLLTELANTVPQDGDLLDLGCGDGKRTIATLVDADPSFTTVGLDVSRVQLELARGLGEPLVQGEMSTLPFSADSFDAVTAYHSVFHVPREDHPAVYAECARVLRPGGHLLMTVGSNRSESTRENWLGSGHAMYWSTPGPAVTKRQLDAAGFVIEWERRVDDPLGSTALFVLARLP